MSTRITRYVYIVHARHQYIQYTYIFFYRSVSTRYLVRLNGDRRREGTKDNVLRKTDVFIVASLRQIARETDDPLVESIVQPVGPVPPLYHLSFHLRDTF